MHNFVSKFKYYISDILRARYIMGFLFGILLVPLVFFGYKGTIRIIASFYFEKGVNVMIKDRDIELAEVYINKAIGFYNKDEYYRMLSEIHLVRLNKLIQLPQDKEVKDKVGERLKKVIRYLEIAIEISPNNYQNWMALGKTYTAFTQSGISLKGSQKAARDAYKKALELNPKDLKDKSQIYFFLSQISIVEGNDAEAIDLLEQAISLYQSEPSTFLQLGILKYKAGDFLEAIQSLEATVDLVPDYSDALYFLGLSYYRVGDTESAIESFEKVERVNPLNNEIKEIIRNLKNRNAPFTVL